MLFWQHIHLDDFFSSGKPWVSRVVDKLVRVHGSLGSFAHHKVSDDS